MFVGALIYADDVTLLAPTSMALKVMGRPIEYVDCTDLLGVSVTSRIKERNVNSSVQKFHYRVNSVLYDFKDIKCDVKAKLLDSYCLDVYGSQL